MSACHKLYQIKRTFVMYEHYQAHRLRSIPFLAPDNRAHALNYASWLRDNVSVTHVAASFQTLQRKKQIWWRYAELLDMIRKEILPRKLVWVLIGQKPRPWLDERFQSVRYIVTPPKPNGPDGRHRVAGTRQLPLGS
jgi:hypothetical protein